MREDQNSTREHISRLRDQLDGTKSASAARRISSEIRTAVLTERSGPKITIPTQPRSVLQNGGRPRLADGEIMALASSRHNNRGGG